LLTAIEQRPDPATGTMNFLQERVVADAVSESRRHQHEWITSVSGRRLLLARFGQFPALAFLVFSPLPLPSPATTTGSRRFFSSTRTIVVTPGDTTLERGNGLVVLARFTGPIPAEATLVVGASPTSSKRIPLVRTLADPVFGGSIPEVGSNLVYHVEYA